MKTVRREYLIDQERTFVAASAPTAISLSIAPGIRRFQQERYLDGNCCPTSRNDPTLPLGGDPNPTRAR